MFEERRKQNKKKTGQSHSSIKYWMDFADTPPACNNISPIQVTQVSMPTFSIVFYSGGP